MRIERQDELVRRLLAPLERVEPVKLVSDDRGRRRRRSLALAIAFATAAGGLAAAAVSGPLNGIFSAFTRCLMVSANRSARRRRLNRNSNSSR